MEYENTGLREGPPLKGTGIRVTDDGVETWEVESIAVHPLELLLADEDESES